MALFQRQRAQPDFQEAVGDDRPALATRLGRPTVERERVPAIVTEDPFREAGLHHFVRGVFAHDGAGRLIARPIGAQGAHLYCSGVRTDGLLHRPEVMEHPEIGTSVEIGRVVW